MTKETVFIIIKTMLTVAGSFLIGKNFIGHPVDQNMLEVIGGILMSAVSVFWSIKDKNYTIESIQAVVRQIILFIGGLLVAKGTITEDKLNGYLGLAASLIPLVQSYLSKKKVTEIQEGKIVVEGMAKIPDLKRKKSGSLHPQKSK